MSDPRGGDEPQGKVGGRLSLGLFLTGLALGLLAPFSARLRRRRQQQQGELPAAAVGARAAALEARARVDAGSSIVPAPGPSRLPRDLAQAAPGVLPRAEDEEPQRWGHAPETTSVRGVGLFAVGLLVALALVQLALWGAAEGFADLSRREGTSIERRIPADVPPDPWTTAEGPPPAPEAPGVPHWEDPPGDLQALQREQERRLLDYRWIDRERGVVGIPIQRAMELLVERRRAEEDAR